MCRDSAWNSGDCVRAAVRPDKPCCRRRPVRFTADRNVLVLLDAALDPDRFHLSIVGNHGDLSDLDFHKLCQGAGAAPPDTFGLWTVPVACADRAARAIALKTRARR